MTNNEMATAIVYDRFEILNESVNQKHPKTRPIGRYVYRPTSKWDYDRVMTIFKEKPDQYKLVNVEYGFTWAK